MMHHKFITWYFALQSLKVYILIDKESIGHICYITVCPRSLDPFCIVSTFIKRLLGYTVALAVYNINFQGCNHRELAQRHSKRGLNLHHNF